MKKQKTTVEILHLPNPLRGEDIHITSILEGIFLSDSINRRL